MAEQASSGINGVDVDSAVQAKLGDSFERFETDIILGDGESADFKSQVNSSSHVHTLAFRSGEALQWLRER